jgi:fumarylacetoacetase
MSNKGDFPIQNLPYGVFQTHSQSIPRLATAFKDNIVDVSGLAQDGKFAKLAPKVQDALKNHISWNEFASFGRQVQRDYRRVLTQIILAEDQSFINYLYPIQEVTLLLPVKIGDYTDFWCSEVHALNVMSCQG